MMHKANNVLYNCMNNESLKFEAISLNFSGYEYFMGIILPYPNELLSNVTSNLKPVDLDEIMVGRFTFMDYKILRFKFSSSMSLKDTLSKLGMRHAFTRTGADFSSLTNEPAYLADVITCS